MTAAFDCGLISSDGGLVLLREAELRLGPADTLAGCIRERRNQVQVVHTLAAMRRLWTPPVQSAPGDPPSRVPVCWFLRCIGLTCPRRLVQLEC